VVQVSSSVSAMNAMRARLPEAQLTPASQDVGTTVSPPVSVAVAAPSGRWDLANRDAADLCRLQ